MAVTSVIEAITWTEQFGKVVEASERVIVTGVSGATARAALAAAMATLGVPVCGDAIDASYPEVIVEQRVPQFIGLDSTGYTVAIDITYRRQIPPSAEMFPRSGGSSLTQIETQKDRLGENITVTYGDKTVVATIAPYEVQDNFSVETVEKTNDPRTLASEYKNHVNDSSFMGSDAGTWLCNGVTYELVNELANPKWYKFTWEFEQREIGWTYTVAYKDEDGNIPENLVEGVGIKDIEWHYEADFASKFA